MGTQAATGHARRLARCGTKGGLNIACDEWLSRSTGASQALVPRCQESAQRAHDWEQGTEMNVSSTAGPATGGALEQARADLLGLPTDPKVEMAFRLVRLASERVPAPGRHVTKVLYSTHANGSAVRA